MVFDEAPLFTSSPFRKNLALIPLMLRSLTRAKFVLLTATVPVSSENELLKGFGVPRATTVRMCTANFNLVHKVKRIGRSAVGRADVTSFLQNQDDCAVIFVKSVAECEKLASSLNEMTEFRSQVAYYHAKLDGKERTDAHQAWKARRKRIMVATTAFAFGVDSANCNLAIHVDGAFDLASYCQGAGRAGRSGQRARSVMLLSSYRRTCGDGLLEHYMMSTSKCLIYGWGKSVRSVYGALIYGWGKSVRSVYGALKLGLRLNSCTGRCTVHTRQVVPAAEQKKLDLFFCKILRL